VNFQVFHFYTATRPRATFVGQSLGLLRPIATLAAVPFQLATNRRRIALQQFGNFDGRLARLTQTV
jgi:hypothetical protein